MKKLLRLPRAVYRRLKCTAQDVLAQYYLKKINKSPKHDFPIKVAFIFQMPEIWEKLCPIYEYMKNDERFLPQIIVVPAHELYNEQLTKKYGFEKEYITNKYPNDNVIIYFKDDGTNIDIAKIGFDYIFYQRPYQGHIPPQLHTCNMVKHTKICFIPYGKETLKTSVQYNSWDFFRHVYFIFLAGNEEKQFFNSRNRRKIHNLNQHLEWLGYPIFEKCHKIINCENKHLRVLWTPRWSYDKNVGGSHFLEYKDFIVRLSKEQPNIEFIIRPHPLMWGNLIKTGLMTQNEVDNYKEQLYKSGIIIDSSINFIEIISMIDILLTDISSIIPEFFLTKKPIIYCPCNIDLNDSYNNLIKTTYIAKNEHDIKQYIMDLLDKKDPLKNKRVQIIQKCFNYLDNATENIVNRIAEDFLQVKNQ